MKNLSFKAILVAFIADFGVSQILATFVSVGAIAAMPQTRALAVSGNVVALTTFLSNWTPFLVLCLVCACVGEVVGGFVAGMLAPLHPKLNALVASGVTILSSVFLLGSYPLWYRVVAIGLVIPCYWLGALWAIQRNTAKLARQRLAAEGVPLSRPH